MTLRQQINQFTEQVIKECFIRNNGDIQNTCAELGIYPKQLQHYRNRFPELNKLIIKRRSGRETNEVREKRRTINARFPDD